MIKAGIIFDIFGTLLLPVQKPQNPYAQILLQSPHIKVGDLKKKLSEDRSFLLRENFTLEEYAYRSVNRDLYYQSVKTDNRTMAFEENNYIVNTDLAPLLEQFHKNNIAVCCGSNLATPYKAIADRLLPGIEHKIYSCDIGFAKPEKEFFENCCTAIGTKPENTFIIGNSLKSDIIGGKEAGLAHGFWLADRQKEDPDDLNIHSAITRLTDIVPHLQLIFS